MCVRVIRTVHGTALRADARAVQPGCDIATRPYPPSRPVSLALNNRVPAFRILRPIEREATTHQPFAEICSVHGTGSNRAAILILGERRAGHRSARNKGVKLVGGLRTAAVQLTIVRAAELSGLRRVDFPKANSLSPNFQSIAIDDAGLPRQLAR